MKVSTSILSAKDNLKETIDKLNNTSTDYIHLDIMDGVFVSNTTWHLDDLVDVLDKNKKPLDVHLMVKDVINYINEFSFLNPEYITFHYEATDEIEKVISYIKSMGIKAGLSINPDTKVEEIYKYLPNLDLVLVMSVNPGMGGQKFIPSTVDKINNLVNYRKDNDLEFIISVDGGINDSTIGLVNTDMVVSGSYITKNDYEESIQKLKND